MVFLQQKREPKAYCNSGSSSLCNSLSCLLAYTVKKIVVATVKEKPTTVNIICGAERPWCSCEASANVRIRIPLQQKQKKNLADKLKHIWLFENLNREQRPWEQYGNIGKNETDVFCFALEKRKKFKMRTSQSYCPQNISNIVPSFPVQTFANKSQPAQCTDQIERMKWKKSYQLRIVGGKEK